MTPYEAARNAISRERDNLPVRSGGVGNGSITVSERQKTVHLVSESAAVLIGAPFLLWLAFKPNREIQAWEKAGLVGFAAATLLVDGGLLLSWLAKSRKEKT